jgi:penicillin-binding protein 1C
VRWRRLRRVALILLGAWLLLRLGVWIARPAPLRDKMPSAVGVYDRKGQLLRLTLAPDGQYRLWTPLPRISPLLVEATLLYEDRWFRWHPGVNPVALARAAFTTYGGGRRIGGSTVTMQLARRLWGIPSHTAGGKLRQLLRALQLELFYDKDEILEAYLNLVPYGGNVEGAGAAAEIYFQKPAERLTLPEAITLAVIPQNPVRRARPGDRLDQARQELWQRWVKRHPEAKRDEPLIRLPLTLHTPRELPFRAPHFVDAILADGASARVETTLDLHQQRLLERHLSAYVARRKPFGIHNAAAMLVDARTMDVLAQVGSADFHDDAMSGQVNGARARRSPGSTLKPFAFALGIDQGVIHPESMLKDAPRAFAAYSPENFDGRFMGPLTAREALVRSRNLPALEVTARLNRPSLYDVIKLGGVALPRDEAHYGLGLVLGTGEVTMEELVGLYGALAHGGVVRPLRARKSDPEAEGTRLFSAEAAFLVVDMLRSNPRPDATLGDERRRLKVAWKTGTSWGFRDAWAVGLVKDYILCVWVGNFSGEGNPAFVGVQAAAPLFFEIIDSMIADDPKLRDGPESPPPGVRRVEVCAVSGQLPGAHCRHKKSAWFIPGKSPIHVCDVHRQVVIDDATGLRTCPPYGGPTHAEVLEFWPSDLLRLFEQAGLPRRPVPPMRPGCEDGDDAPGQPPRIASPLAGVTYTLRHKRAGQERIALEAVTDGGAGEVFWFVDDAFVGRAKSGAPFFWDPAPLIAGRTRHRFVVRAVDDWHRADAREVRVEVQ